MKKQYLICVIFLNLCNLCLSQTPQFFKYQAIASDKDGKVLTNKRISLRVNIIEGSASGVVVYSETHSETTNQLGMAYIPLGSGKVVKGDFSNIDWSSNSFYIQIEMDEKGGKAYQMMGTPRLFSVPYSMYTPKACNIDDADADSTNELQRLSFFNDTLFLSKSNFVVFADNVFNDADADTANELQELSLKKTRLSISKGNSVKLPFNFNDTSAVNELQKLTFKKKKNTLSISKGNKVKLPFNFNDTSAVNELQKLTFKKKKNTLSISKGNAVKLPFNFNDTSTVNELQKLSFKKKKNTLSISKGNAVKLPFNYNDTSAANELQKLSIKKNTLSISKGNAVKLPINNNDTSATNELQTLSLSGDTVFISGGNYIIIPNLSKIAAPNYGFRCGDRWLDPRDGKTYATVKIGTQCWMAENLNIGKMIAAGSRMPTNNKAIEKWCHGGADGKGNSVLKNCNIYGGLYSWKEMMDYSTSEGVQGICPADWHVPTDAEFKKMEMALNPPLTKLEADASGWRGKDQGDQLKKPTECSGKNCGTSGFDGLLTGTRNTAGLFYKKGKETYLWTSTLHDEANAIYRYLDVKKKKIFRSNYSKANGFCVRCVKD